MSTTSIPLDYEDLKPDHREKITVARRSAESLRHILDNILDFSKLEAGRIEVELETCDPGYIVDSVVQVLRPKAAEKGLDLTCRMQPSVPAAVVTDPTRLRQILYNLIGNAIKFTESGHVAVVALTAHASESAWKECAEAGMNAFATKPIRLPPDARQGRPINPRIMRPMRQHSER